MIVPGLFISILKGREIARAIEARGFTYDPAHRTYRKDLRLEAKDIVMMLLCVALSVLILYLNIEKGWFDTTFVWDLLTK